MNSTPRAHSSTAASILSADCPTSPTTSRLLPADRRSCKRTKDSHTRQSPFRSATPRSSKTHKEHARRHRREAGPGNLGPGATNPPLRHAFRSAHRCPDQSTHHLRTRHLSSNHFRQTCGRPGLRLTRRPRTHRRGNRSMLPNQTERTEEQSPPHHSSRPHETRRRHHRRTCRKRCRTTSKRLCSSQPS